MHSSESQSKHWEPAPKSNGGRTPHVPREGISSPLVSPGGSWVAWTTGGPEGGPAVRDIVSGGQGLQSGLGSLGDLVGDKKMRHS